MNSTDSELLNSQSLVNEELPPPPQKKTKYPSSKLKKHPAFVDELVPVFSTG